MKGETEHLSPLDPYLPTETLQGLEGRLKKGTGNQYGGNLWGVQMRISSPPLPSLPAKAPAIEAREPYLCMRKSIIIGAQEFLRLSDCDTWI